MSRLFNFLLKNTFFKIITNIKRYSETRLEELASLKTIDQLNEEDVQKNKQLNQLIEKAKQAEVKGFQLSEELRLAEIILGEPKEVTLIKMHINKHLHIRKEKRDYQTFVKIKNEILKDKDNNDKKVWHEFLQHLLKEGFTEEQYFNFFEKNL